MNFIQVAPTCVFPVFQPFYQQYVMHTLYFAFFMKNNHLFHLIFHPFFFTNTIVRDIINRTYFDKEAFILKKLVMIILLTILYQSIVFPIFTEAAQQTNTLYVLTSDKKTAYIPANTKINLYLLYPLDSKTARAGEKVFFKTIENININNITVIPAGSIAVGKVKTAESAGILGQDGKLSFSADSIKTINNINIPLSCHAAYTSSGDYTVKKQKGLESIFKTLVSTGADVYCDAGTIYEAIVLLDTSLDTPAQALPLIISEQPSVDIKIYNH
jgi:hypothetical protein